MPKKIFLVLNKNEEKIEENNIWLSIPSILDKNNIKYNNIKNIGAGKMGEVLDLGNNTVLKITSDEKEMINSDILSHYEHPNIVKFFKVFKIDNSKYLVDFYVRVVAFIIEEKLEKPDQNMKKLLSLSFNAFVQFNLEKNRWLDFSKPEYKDFLYELSVNKNIKLGFISDFFERSGFNELWENTEHARTKYKTVENLKRQIIKDFQERKKLNPKIFEPFDGYLDTLLFIRKKTDFRDFHAENIMFDPKTNKYKFIDFGVASAKVDKGEIDFLNI